MGEELLKNMQKEMDVYIDGMLLGTMDSVTTNVEPSTLTMEDMKYTIKHTYEFINKPREATFTIDNPKVDQFQLAQLMGMKVMEVDIVKKYVQRKTHKKKRINKKWLKRYGTYPIYDDNCYMINNTLIGSPKTINKLREYYKVN